jgi:aspartate--ammonia ligase
LIYEIKKKRSSSKIIPDRYSSKLDFFDTEKAIKLVKDTFEKKLAKKLHLLRVSAPKFLITGTGLQDDLAGTQTPVKFQTKFSDKDIEVVHSLAKWKRHMLGKHLFKVHTGLYTDMDAIRKDEDVDEIHSIYVDQWDWEQVITEQDRTLKYLKSTVKKIYAAILESERTVTKKFPKLQPQLTKKIHFIHSETLEEQYPELTPKQREDKITEKYGAVFIIGIGYPLKSGMPHDLRAADYDDWYTATSSKTRGLDGDILVWDPIGRKALELSSMGIRVDKKSLLVQLEMMGQMHRKKLEFHKGIIKGTTPLTIGGGIGQSRLCMILLQKAHIGEVQSSVWPEHTRKMFKKKRAWLL